MKKLLLLGGLRYLIPVIQTAHKLGVYVITCDYIPENVAHKYSDEYYNVSIMDKDAILSLANKLNIDGIMSFAVDPGVLTAAYVAEKMGLPGCPYKSVKILQNKDLFRRFLTENNFDVPRAKGFKSYDEVLKELDSFRFPIIVKPVDAAGSKGVSMVRHIGELTNAVSIALQNSVSENRIIIEEFIQQLGFSSDTDSFSVDSDLKFISFSNQYFDSKAANPYVPSAYSWPSTIPEVHTNKLVLELKRLVKLLELGTSIYNIEVRLGTNNIPYIMEVSPRGGGNRLSEMLKYATDTDLIKNAILSALGEQVETLKMPSYQGFWAEVILHADRNGTFEELEINDEIKANNLIETDLWIETGTQVKAFNAANDAIGTMVLRFDSQDEMHNRMSSIAKWLKIRVS